MSLVALVSTVNSVLAVDVHTGRHEVVDRGRGVYYGIARADAGPLVASRREGIDSDGRPDEPGAVLRLSTKGAPAELLEPPIAIRDAHQMIEHDGCWFIVCSRDEKVVIRRGEEWSEWSPIPDSTTDEHHVNSIVADGESLHVLAHNWDEQRDPSLPLASGRATDRPQRRCATRQPGAPGVHGARTPGPQPVGRR